MSARHRRSGDRRPRHEIPVPNLEPAAVPAGVYIAVPSLLLCAMPLFVAGYAFRQYWFTERALYGWYKLEFFAFWASLFLAVLVCVWPRARALVMDHLDRLGRLEPPRQAGWLVAAYFGLFSLLYFLKYCQYRGSELPIDTTATANLVYNFAHSGTLESTVLGVPNYLSVHFMPGVVSLAPALLLWNDIQALMLVQTMLVASIPVAAYLLAFRKSGSTACAWAALWLVFISPFFIYLAAASVAFQVALPAFFLWGIYFVETGRWKAAGLCGLALVLTIEQTPILFFGMGLYLIIKMGPRTRRAWLTGGGVCLGSILLWFIERRIMQSYPRNGVVTGEVLANLAPNLPALLNRTLHEPLAVARAVFFPLSNLKPLRNLILSAGAAFLFSPGEMIPWAVNFLPSLVSGGYYHDLRLHYAAYVVGPFWWSVALGLANVHLWLERRGWAHVLLASVLLVGMGNLYYEPNILLPDWNRTLFSEVPSLVPLIPPTASVWAEEFLSPWVSCRQYIWPILQGTDFSTPGLFVPDYILMRREWLDKARPETAALFLAFLSREKYVKVSERSSVVLLRHPGAPLTPPPRFQRPTPELKARLTYGVYLAGNDFLPDTARLFLDMAQQGDAVAQFSIGSMYFRGAGVTQDYGEALRWFRSAAEQGRPDAETMIGDMYYSGLGVKKDPDEALRLFRRAADRGFVGAQNSVGTYYASRGEWAEGEKWLRKAAEQGFDPAEFNLGLCLMSAPVPLHDMKQGISWMRKAADQGNEGAKKALMQLGQSKP